MTEDMTGGGVCRRCSSTYVGHMSQRLNSEPLRQTIELPEDEDIRQVNKKQIESPYEHGHSNAIDVVEARVPTGQPYHSHVLTVAVGNHWTSAVVEASEQKGVESSGSQPKSQQPS